MAEFELYDVAATCRDCGAEFQTKAFSAAVVPRFGLCAECGEKAKARAHAREHPRDEPRAKREIPELTPPRRIWEPD